MPRVLTVLVSLLALLIGSIGVPSAPSAHAANTLTTNPLGFAYSNVANVVGWYGRPAGMVITGRCNRYWVEFETARANGAEVLAYLAPGERPDSPVCALDTTFYGGNLATTPLWPYPTYGARVNWPGTHLTDIRAGLAWSDHVVSYIEDLMVQDKVDGVFLDVVGARLWSTLADWTSWPQGERDQWTAGMVDLVRRLDASRRALNPRFIIVNNGNWDGAGPAGTAGEPYVDGVCLEHHPSTSAYHQGIANRAYGNLGHRRVLAIAQSTSDAQGWANVQGITNVSDQQTYAAVSAPPIGFHRVIDRPKKFGRTTIAATPSTGMTANQKRGSKFTLTDKAALLNFSAYLDGQGGAAGTQSIRAVLYQDNAGVPAARIAQSNIVTITAGAAPGWVAFTAPTATALNPGTYWIALHTGDTAGVARNRGDGAANWYANADPFADGATNPFGTGNTGSVTLSVNVSYTVGY